MSFPKYKKYKDSGVEWLGEVPEGWSVKKLKHVCNAFPSNVDKKTRDGEPTVQLCNYTDVYYNEEINENFNFMRASATPDQILKFQLKSGDTIITKDSESADDIAVASYVAKDLRGVVCGYHLSIIRPQKNIHGKFIKWLFWSTFTKSCCSIMANGLTRMGLGQYAVDNLPIPLPPLPEQTAIAKFLDRETQKIDNLVAEQRRLIELLKEKRQSVISDAVTKGIVNAAYGTRNDHLSTPDHPVYTTHNSPLVPSGVEWLGEVPDGWEVKKIRHMVEILRGKFTHRPRNDPSFYDGQHPFIQTGDISNSSNRYILEYKQTLNDRGATVSKKFPQGTLVMTIAANIGDVAILGFPAYFPDSVVGLVPKQGIDVEYLYFLISAMKEPLVRNATSNAQMNLNNEQIGSILIVCPSFEQQKIIKCYLDSELTVYDNLITESQRAIDLLQERRTALISAAVTGQIDVRDLN